jgi:uncharacterized protein YndB with AHSA1/START domain
MTVTSVRKDPEALTMSITTELDATVDRCWQLLADPRQLERWWGPPTYPATFVDHDLSTGGRVSYFMTGPDGDKAAGWWEVLAADPPHRLELNNGFAEDSGARDDSMPTMIMVFTLTERDGGGTVLAIETRFPSLEAMEQLLSMGMDEGMTAAVGQIDEILVGAPGGARVRDKGRFPHPHPELVEVPTCLPVRARARGLRWTGCRRSHPGLLR